MSTALISVSDKQQLVPFVKQLHAQQFDIISSGGTHQLLQKHQLPAQRISDLTHFPEIMDGRVKTLHPKIHGGILADRQKHQQELERHHIRPIDWVIVNLYPFQETIHNPDCDFKDAIEHIDIGGPTLIRAAAKNHQQVVVIVDPNDYDDLIQAYQAEQQISPDRRLELAQKAFQHIAEYDRCIADWISQQSSRSSTTYSTANDNSPLPQQIQLQFRQQQALRYGENPHQAAAFYVPSVSIHGHANTIAQAKLLQGKPLSYNNLMDADACWETLKQLTTPTKHHTTSPQHYCVIVKHATTCGAASADTLQEAYEKAFACDPNSAFGGIIAVNQRVHQCDAELILNQQFLEILIAPAFSDKALAVLQQKPNIRVLQTQALPVKSTPVKSTDDPIHVDADQQSAQHAFEIRQLNGGILYQQANTPALDQHAPNWRTVTQTQFTEQQLIDAQFAWNLVKRIKSNAIVFVKEGQSLGIGGGQTSRVFATQTAILKAAEAKLSLQGSVLASDAFFPFADSIEQAAQQQVAAIIQPGGSRRDAEVINAANQHGIAMIFTARRQFLH